jgi:hypothetical protein
MNVASLDVDHLGRAVERIEDAAHDWRALLDDLRSEDHEDRG